MKNIKESERIAKILVRKGVKDLSEVTKQEIQEISTLEFETFKMFDYFMTLLNFDFTYQLRKNGITV